MFFRPRLIPTLIVLPLLAALLALGFWQLDRREWKHELIAVLEEREAAAPAALPERLEPETLEFSRVELTGELLHERELYWAARTRDGVSGYHVLTPMRLADGREVILDRGWLAPEDLDRARRQTALPEGEVTLVASARQGGWGGPDWAAWLRPVNDPEGNRWLWPDLEAMAEVADLERPVTDLYFLVEPGELPSPPEAVGGHIEVRDDHLQYALFWFSMAGALILIYVLFHRRPSLRKSSLRKSSPRKSHQGRPSE